MEVFVYSYLISLLTGIILLTTSIYPMEVKIFNVGQGNCTVVSYPGQPSLLIDAGSDQLPLQGKEAIIGNIASYITQKSPQGFCVLISHPEKDHAGWISEIFSRLDHLPQSITVGGSKESYAKFLPTKLIPYLYDCNAITSRNPSHLPFYCSLWHTGSGQKNTNNQSLIVCVEDTTFRVILPGDSGQKTFNASTTAPSPKPTYLVANHHGSEKDGANSEQIIRHLYPQAVVVSSGMHGKYHHPHYKALQAMATETSIAPYHYINGQTAPNLSGDDKTQAVINYRNGFSVYRSPHPIYTTNNAGDITITANGLQCSEAITSGTSEDQLSILPKKYFTDFSFDTIQRLFLARMGLTNAHMKQLHRLPLALTYFDLQNNTISAAGFARLLQLLQFHSQRLAIKTTGNVSTEVSDLKPLLNGNSESQIQPTINLCWNTLMGCRLIAQDQPCQLQNIVSTPHSQIISKPTNKWTLPFQQLQELLITACNNHAQAYSTQLFSNESEFFIHYPNRTEWCSSFYNFHPIEIHHAWGATKAAWRKNADFFLSDGIYTYVFELQEAGPIFKSQVDGSPHFIQRPDQSTGLSHIITCPSNGMGEQDLVNLENFRFGLLQPISKDGNGLLTIHHGNTLLISKKNNGIFTTITTRNFPNIKSAGFCDADQSIVVKFENGQEESLPLIMEML